MQSCSIDPVPGQTSALILLTWHLLLLMWHLLLLTWHLLLLSWHLLLLTWHLLLLQASTVIVLHPDSTPDRPAAEAIKAMTALALASAGGWVAQRIVVQVGQLCQLPVPMCQLPVPMCSKCAANVPHAGM
jgi:hypothetical protein